MEIKFIKDYRNYKKGQIIKKPRNIANKLISEGIAEFVEKSYIISELYVGKIIETEKDNLDFVYVKGDSKHIGIFTKKFNGGSEIKPEYTHVITNKKFINNNILNYSTIEMMKKKLLIDDRAIKKFIDLFFKKMIELGWTINTKISIKDIINIEKEINEKIKLNPNEYNLNNNEFKNTKDSFELTIIHG